ncbi:MAG: hypothetical protein ABIO17_04060 [Pseudoxanthomonas sp.]
MNRYGWILLRAYLPALVALVLALLCMLWTSFFSSVATLQALVPYAKWLPPLFLLAALVAGLTATLGLWRWQQDKAPKCATCGGPLAGRRHGPHGDTRKCLACGHRQPVQALQG